MHFPMMQGSSRGLRQGELFQKPYLMTRAGMRLEVLVSQPTTHLNPGLYLTNLQVYNYVGEEHYLKATKASALTEVAVSRDVHKHFVCPTLIEV